MQDSTSLYATERDGLCGLGGLAPHAARTLPISNSRRAPAGTPTIRAGAEVYIPALLTATLASCPLALAASGPARPHAAALGPQQRHTDTGAVGGLALPCMDGQPLDDDACHALVAGLTLARPGSASPDRAHPYGALVQVLADNPSCSLDVERLVDGCVRCGLAGAAPAGVQLQLHVHCLRSLAAALEARARSALSPTERGLLSDLGQLGLTAEKFRQLAAQGEQQMQRPPLDGKAVGGTPLFFVGEDVLNEGLCQVLAGVLTSASSLSAVCLRHPYAGLVGALVEASDNCLDARSLLNGCVRHSLASLPATSQQVELRTLCARCLAAAV